MAQCLIQVLQEYEIEDRLGYFVLDNAESNDICIDTVLHEIRPDLNALDRSKRRLRCWGHILNLAAKAFLFGQDPDAFEIEAEMNQNLSREEEDLKLWRKRGSVGKLHNVVVFGRRSPQRRELFESISLANDDGTNQSSNLMITQDNETRWNSTYLMITRALHLKREIEVFIDRCQLSPDPKKRVPKEDHLQPEDWRILAETVRILKPFYSQTMRLQSRGENASYGSIWEVLPSMEFLLEHMESLKTEYAGNGVDTKNAASSPLISNDDLIIESRKHFRTAINNSWAKLDKYYSAMDSSPIYGAALVLNPGHRWHYMEEKWTSQRQKTWLKKAKEEVRTF